MNKKKLALFFICVGILTFAFVKREELRVAYLTGQEVEFPNLPQRDNKKRLLIVGSEDTISSQLVERISNECTELVVIPKVNRFTNLGWQERHELHGMMRAGKYELVLIEAFPYDFSKENRDRIARFESSARKSNSRLFFWSPRKPRLYPSNFRLELPDEIAPFCDLK